MQSIIRWAFLFIASIAMASPAAAQAPAPLAAVGQAGWSPAGQGCHVWNPGPTTGETVAWTGGCRNARADGQGTLVWGVPGQQSTYQGMYVDGRRHGKGRMTYNGGNTYDGDWENDLRHGLGTMTFLQGGSVSMIYEGSFVRGRAHGAGVVTNKMAGRVDRVTAEEGCILMGQAWIVIGTSRGSCRH